MPSRPEPSIFAKSFSATPHSALTRIVKSAAIAHPARKLHQPHTFRPAIAHVGAMNNSRPENVDAPSLPLAQAATASNNHQPACGRRRQDPSNLFAAVIAGFLLCTLQFTARAHEFDFRTNAGGITIFDYTGPGGNVIIPNTIMGVPVLEIGLFTFSGRQDVTGVTIPESVTRIRSWAFKDCTGLTNVTIPNSVTTIESYTFAGCTTLPSIFIPSSVTFMGGFDPGRCCDGGPAFQSCLSLKAINVDPLNSAFSSLDGVLLNKNGTKMLLYPYGRIGNYTIPDGVQAIGTAFANCGNLTGVKFGSGVTNIEWDAFSGCTEMTNVTLSESIISIGNGAFRSCTKLTSIYIPRSVIDIGDGTGGGHISDPAFYACTKLTALVVDPMNPAYTSPDGILFNKSQSTLVHYPNGRSGKYAVPSHVSFIHQAAFQRCTELTEITIPDSVIDIGNYAFAECHRLTNIIIGNGITRIRSEAFLGTVGWASITIGTGVTNIPANTFRYNTNHSVAVYFRGNPPTVSSLAFPEGTVAYYLPGTSGWGNSIGGRPTAWWLPQTHSASIRHDAGMNTFCFTVNWASGQTVVIETCPNLTSPSWVPLQTNVLAGDSHRFSVPEWASHPARYYRLTTLQGN